MRFSNDGNAWTDWEPYAGGNREWDLSLGDGAKTVHVEYKDGAGNIKRAEDSISLDTTEPPIPTITGGPLEGSTSTARSATFTFSSEDGATFLCSVDGASFSGCTSGQQFTVQSDGEHRFEVKAKDQVGNESAPSVRLWNVDATAPTIKNWTPRGTGIKPTAKPTVIFSEAMDETSLEKSRLGKPTTFFLKKGSTKVAATVNYVETQTATGAKVYKAVMTPSSPLSRGTTYTATVTVAARDAAGNALEVTKTWKFTVG